MKIGSAVVGIHIAVLCAFFLTQGCVTTESKGSGLGAGARHKGPWHHKHMEMESETSMAPVDMTGMEMGMGTINEPVIINSQNTTPEPNYIPTTPTETYIVQKGDILSKLAVRFDTTTAELVRLNNLSNPDVLYVGQELRVPAGHGGKSKSTTSKSSSSIKKGGTYTIQKGDTLSGIALAAGVSVNDLRSLNNIKGDMIRAGDTLDIPAGGKVPAKPKKAAATPKKVEQPKSEPVEPTPPPAELAPAPVVDTASAVAPAESVDMIQEYIFYPGDSLDDIAQKYGVTKAEIMRLNNITDESQIQNGQRLRIPIAE